jgi:hypothetical protein
MAVDQYFFNNALLEFIFFPTFHISVSNLSTIEFVTGIIMYPVASIVIDWIVWN